MRRRLHRPTRTVWSIPSTRILKSWKNPRTPDINGDGRADLAILTTNQADRAVRYYVRPMLSNGFGAAFTTGSERQLEIDSMVVTGDWNADGCSDVMQLRKVLVSDCAGSFTEIGTAPTRATGDGLLTVMPADWNGDGRTDLLYIDYYTNDWTVIASTGDGAAAAGRHEHRRAERQRMVRARRRRRRSGRSRGSRWRTASSGTA